MMLVVINVALVILVVSVSVLLVAMLDTDGSGESSTGEDIPSGRISIDVVSPNATSGDGNASLVDETDHNA